MATHRIHKNKNYTTISNYHLRDNKLSLNAKGLLSLVLSLPDDWNYTEKGLETLSSDGLTKVKSTINELISAGYLVRTQSKEQGKFSNSIYDWYEKPITGLPMSENPITENPTQINTNILNTNILKENKNNKLFLKERQFIPPTIEEIEEYCKERNNGVNAKQFFDYYSVNDWKDNRGKQIKNWKQKMIANWEGKVIKETPKKPYSEIIDGQMIWHYN